MDVSWKREEIKNGTNGSGFNLVAVLVDDYGRENHAKVQFSKQPGVIPEKFLKSKALNMRAFHQGLFWVRVDKNLSRLGLCSEDREKIEIKISETVPRPDRDLALWSVTCIPHYDS